MVTAAARSASAASSESSLPSPTGSSSSRTSSGTVPVLSTTTTATDPPPIPSSKLSSSSAFFHKHLSSRRSSLTGLAAVSRGRKDNMADNALHTVIVTTTNDCVPRNAGEDESDSESSPDTARGEGEEEGSNSSSNVDLRHFGPGFWLSTESHPSHHYHLHHAHSAYPKQRQQQAAHNSQHQSDQDYSSSSNSSSSTHNKKKKGNVTDTGQNLDEEMYSRFPYEQGLIASSQLASISTQSIDMTRNSSSSSSNVPSSSSTTLDMPPSYSPEGVPYIRPREVSLEGQKEVDLETFRQARACGMTLDPIRIALPFVYTSRYKSIVESESRNRRRRSSIGSGSSSQRFEVLPSLRDGRFTPPSTFSSPGSSPSKSKFLISNLDPSNAFQSNSKECDAYQNGLGITYATPATTITAITSSSALGLTTQPPPLPPPLPRVPALNPQRQLQRLRVLLLRRHHENVLSDPYSRNEDEYEKRFPSCLEELIDLDWLLREREREYDLDTRSEGVREGVRCHVHVRYELDDGSVFGMKENLESQRSVVVGSCELRHRVFGQPLSLTRTYASRVYPVAGYQHELPIVAFACVEELYRTGMTVPGLFRAPPDRVRHSELIDVYDTGPSFGSTRSLAKENTADICALLRSYIDRLPRALWHESLYDALLVLCVRPSAERERRRLEESEYQSLLSEAQSTSRRGGLRPTSLIVPFASASPGSPQPVYRPRSLSLRNISLSNSLSASSLQAAAAAALSTSIGINECLSEEDEELEKEEILMCRLLFRLLPRPSLSLLAYLCGFFTQLPLSIQNQLSIEDIARLFATPLFLGKPRSSRNSMGSPSPDCSRLSSHVLGGFTWAEKKEEAGQMMEWILRRWAQISEGLFDPDPDQAEEDSSDEQGVDETNRFGGRVIDVSPAVVHELGTSALGRTCDDKLDTPSATSSDTESVHSIPSSYTWSSSNPSLGLSPLSQPVNPATLGLGSSFLRPLSPIEPLESSLSSPPSEKMRNVDTELDMTWKCLVGNDNNELRCTLMDVRSRSRMDNPSSTAT